MKKIILLLLFVFLLSACKSGEYIIISSEAVDGYMIYHKEQNGLFCNVYYEDIFYSGVDYNYGYSFKGCSADMSYFIKTGPDDYLYLGKELKIDVEKVKDII